MCINTDYLEKVATKYLDPITGKTVRRISSSLLELTGIEDKALAKEALRNQLNVFRGINLAKQYAKRGRNIETYDTLKKQVFPFLDDEFKAKFPNINPLANKVVYEKKPGVLAFDPESLQTLEDLFKSRTMPGYKQGLTYTHAPKSEVASTISHTSDLYAGAEKERAFLEIERRNSNKVERFLKEKKGLTPQLDLQRASLEEGLENFAYNNNTDRNQRSILLKERQPEFNSNNRIKRLQKDYADIIHNETGGAIFAPSNYNDPNSLEYLQLNEYLKQIGKTRKDYTYIRKGSTGKGVLVPNWISPEEQAYASNSPIAMRVTGTSLGDPIKGIGSGKGMYPSKYTDHGKIQVIDTEFTPPLFSNLKQKQPSILDVTLGVGNATKNPPLFNLLNNHVDIVKAMNILNKKFRQPGTSVTKQAAESPRPKVRSSRGIDADFKSYLADKEIDFDLLDQDEIGKLKKEFQKEKPAWLTTKEKRARAASQRAIDEYNLIRDAIQNANAIDTLSNADLRKQQEMQNRAAKFKAEREALNQQYKQNIQKIESDILNKRLQVQQEANRMKNEIPESLSFLQKHKKKIGWGVAGAATLGTGAYLYNRYNNN